jgi:hypothetical protein
MVVLHPNSSAWTWKAPAFDSGDGAQKTAQPSRPSMPNRACSAICCPPHARVQTPCWTGLMRTSRDTGGASGL